MIAPPARPIERRAKGSHPGLGCDQVRFTPQGASYQKNGRLLGVHAFLKHDASGTDWAFCCNGGSSDAEAGPRGALPQAVNAIEAAMQAIEKWPSIDLFLQLPYRPGR